MLSRLYSTMRRLLHDLVILTAYAPRDVPEKSPRDGPVMKRYALMPVMVIVLLVGWPAPLGHAQTSTDDPGRDPPAGIVAAPVGSYNAVAAPTLLAALGSGQSRA